jgi:hypothetical protein
MGFFGQVKDPDGIRVIWAVQLGYFSTFPASQVSS